MFEENFDVIVVGSATRDVLMATKGFELRKNGNSPTGVEQCFPLGTKIEIGEIFFVTGGGGTNAAVTFGRQEVKTACIGVVGRDTVGQEIMTELVREKVNVDYFQIHDDDYTAYSVILVGPKGERTILSYKGEGQHFEVGEIPFAKLKTKWFFIDSLGGRFEILEEVVKRAEKIGAKIAMNPGGRELAHGLEKLEPILKRIDIFICNQEEGARLVGVEYSDGERILEVLKEYVKGLIVITDGQRGVKLLAPGGVRYYAGVPSSPIVERTGAGDAFGSGFVVEYMRSGLIEKAIKFATANASSVVTKYGGKAGILGRGDWGPWPLVEVVKK